MAGDATTLSRFCKIFGRITDIALPNIALAADGLYLLDFLPLMVDNGFATKHRRTLRSGILRWLNPSPRQIWAITIRCTGAAGRAAFSACKTFAAAR